MKNTPLTMVSFHGENLNLLNVSVDFHDDNSKFHYS